MAAAAYPFLFLLWPILAIAGGLGFSAMLTVLAVLGVASIGRTRPRVYIAALVAFLAFEAISTLWSPRALTLFEIDLADGDFNVRSEVLRIGLGLFASALVAMAVEGFSDKARSRLVNFAVVAMVIHIVLSVVLAIYETEALNAVAGRLISDAGEGVQDLTRSNQIMAVSAPFVCLSLFQVLRGRGGEVLALLAAAAIAGVLIFRGVYAGVLAMALAGAAMAVVAMFRRNGFRVLGLGIAAIIMTAPLVVGYVSKGVSPDQITNSINWRQAIWTRVLEIVHENPWIGGGLGVLRTIDDRIPSGELAGQLVVPNHSHNMIIQVWAEVGAVGAALISLAIILAAWRLPRPEALGVTAYRTAGLAGSLLAVSAVSYDLWNEWWWAVAGLLVALTRASTATVTPVSRNAPVALGPMS